MKVHDISGSYQVDSIHELESVLRRRDENCANAFWLSHDDNPYPVLSLLVKGELATLHYMPKEYEAGCRSVGKMMGVKKGESTRFAISKYRGDDVYVLNEALLPFPVALEVAKEFFLSDKLPQSVEWFDL